MFWVGVNSIVRDKPTYKILASYWDSVKLNNMLVPPTRLNRVKSGVRHGERGGRYWSIYFIA